MICSACPPSKFSYGSGWVVRSRVLEWHHCLTVRYSAGLRVRCGAASFGTWFRGKMWNESAVSRRPGPTHGSEPVAHTPTHIHTSDDALTPFLTHSKRWHRVWPWQTSVRWRLSQKLLTEKGTSCEHVASTITFQLPGMKTTNIYFKKWGTPSVGNYDLHYCYFEMG